MNTIVSMTGSGVCTDVDGAIAHITIARPEKRNAISDAALDALNAAFANLPKTVRCVILSGQGGHFSAGLDLSEHVTRSPEEVLYHSRNWHSVMDRIQFGGPPVIAVLAGAVMGGGLELAAACHVRVAEPSTIYQLPETNRGIFVGGGATVRVGRILGADRMVAMMLTGRRYNAVEGEQIGLSHYLVEEGAGMPKARELAHQIAQNSSLINYLVIHSVTGVEDMPRGAGLLTESLSAAISQTGPDAEEGLKAFLERRRPQFR